MVRVWVSYVSAFYGEQTSMAFLTGQTTLSIVRSMNWQCYAVLYGLFITWSRYYYKNISKVFFFSEAIEPITRDSVISTGPTCWFLRIIVLAQLWIVAFQLLFWRSRQ